MGSLEFIYRDCIVAIFLGLIISSFFHILCVILSRLPLRKNKDLIPQILCLFDLDVM